MRQPLLATALLLSCAIAPKPTADPPAPPAAAQEPSPAQAAAADLALLRTDVESLLRAQAEILWRSWITGEPAGLERASASRARVLAPASLALVKRSLASAQGGELRALQLLHAYLVGEHLAAATAPSADRLAAARAAASVVWDGRQEPLRRVTTLLAGEAEAGRRAALEKLRLAAERRLAPLAEAHERDLESAARRLGYDGTLALAAELRGAPPDALAALARSVLAATRAPYRAFLAGLARREMGVPGSSLRGRDLPRLLHASEDPRAFPAARVVPDVLAALAGAGIPLADRPGVVLDLEQRPRKDPRALVLPVEVPGGVRLSFAPTGGIGELRSLLREAGAAAYYAHVEAPELEFRRLGQVAPEAWGLLLEDLAGDPSWLAERTGLSEQHLEPFVRAGAVRRLHLAREDAARVLLEIGRAREPRRAEELARGLCETAFDHPVEAEEAALFASPRDPTLHAADGLRAVLLAAQAAELLDRRAKGPWWRSKESGTWLAHTWASGSRLAPEELSSLLGQSALDAGALAASARARAEAGGIRLEGPEPP